MATRREILEIFAQAIRTHEGYFQPLWGKEVGVPKSFKYPNGTVAWRYKNPGNLVYIGQYGATKGSVHGFAIFRTYAEGWSALLNDINYKFIGKSRTGLNPNSTILQFFQKYAPKKDGNNPVRYATAVCAELKTKGLEVNIHDSLGKLMSFATDQFKILAAVHESANQGKISGVLGSFVQYLNNTFGTKKFEVQILPITKTALNYTKINAHVGVGYDLKEVEIVDMKQLENLLRDKVLDHKLVIFCDGDGRGLTCSTNQEIDGALVNQMNFIPFHNETVFLDDLIHEFAHYLYRVLNKAGAGLKDDVHSYSSITDQRPEARYTALLQKLKPQLTML